jgi:hypothetical protein
MAVEPNLTPLWWAIIVVFAFIGWVLYRVQYPGYQQIDGKIYRCCCDDEEDEEELEDLYILVEELDEDEE